MYFLGGMDSCTWHYWCSADEYSVVFLVEHDWIQNVTIFTTREVILHHSWWSHSVLLAPRGISFSSSGNNWSLKIKYWFYFSTDIRSVRTRVVSPLWSIANFKLAATRMLIVSTSFYCDIELLYFSVDYLFWKKIPMSFCWGTISGIFIMGNGKMNRHFYIKLFHYWPVLIFFFFPQPICFLIRVKHILKHILNILIKNAINLIKVWNYNFYDTTTGMQWYKGKKIFFYYVKNRKIKTCFASVMSNSLFRYIYTPTMLWNAKTVVLFGAKWH